MENTLKTPLNWYGGKGRLASAIATEMGDHKLYVEVFGGGAAVLFHKAPSSIEVYNDLDGNLTNFWDVLRGPKGNALIQRLRFTPHSRVEHERCKKLNMDALDPVERARVFYLLVQQSFARHFSGSYAISGTRQAVAPTWANKIDRMPEAIERLRRVQVENLDFRQLIPLYDKPDTLFYLDPPYMHNTRTAGAAYRKEMSDDDHADLIRIIRRCRGKVMLSGYPSKLYDGALKRWRREDQEVYCAAGNRRGCQSGDRIEVLWCNF